MLGIVQMPQIWTGLGHRSPLQEVWDVCDPLSKEMLPVVQPEPPRCSLELFPGVLALDPREKTYSGTIPSHEYLVLLCVTASVMGFCALPSCSQLDRVCPLGAMAHARSS